MSEDCTNWDDGAGLAYVFPRRSGMSRLTAPLALVLTLCLFLLLPISEWLTPAPRSALALRTVEVTTARIPPPKLAVPPPPRPPREKEPEPEREAVPSPELDVPRAWTRPAPRLPVQLSALMPDLRGDFALDFDIAPLVAAPPPSAPVPEPAVFEVEQLDRPPVVLLQIPPVYPYRARVRGTEGYVDVRLTVTAEGTATDISVVNSVPGDTFVANATKAVRRWRFEPGLKEGCPVAARLQVRMRFELK